MSLRRSTSLLFQHVTLIELEAKTSIALQELAIGSPWWSRTLQIAARLKRQTTCGDYSQCGNGNNNNNGSSNGVNNSGGGGGGTSATDRNIALGVGLGVGIPSAIAAITTIYECMTGHSSPVPGMITIYRLITTGRKNKSQSPNSGPQQKGGAQSQRPQPHGVPGLENYQSPQRQGQEPVELET